MAGASAVACLTAATGRRLGASARLGVAIVGLYFITGIKETQNGTRAARTRARFTSTLTQQLKDAGSLRRSGFFDQKRDVSESVHGS